jgi:7-keto-8-aminopelargonate synthetase-like enzyme
VELNLDEIRPDLERFDARVSAEILIAFHGSFSMTGQVV